MSNRNVNKIIVVGNLGHTPQLRHTAKGNAVTTFSLATNRRVKNAQGESEDQTHWHRATVWGKRAEACAKYLAKGASVYVEGEMVFKDWVDKQGAARHTAEIIVDDIKFLTMGRRENPERSDAPTNGEQPIPSMAQ